MKRVVWGLAFLAGCSNSLPRAEVMNHYENNRVYIRATREFGGFELIDVSAKEAAQIKATLDEKHWDEWKRGYFILEQSAMPGLYHICISFPEDLKGVPAIRLHDLLKEAKLEYETI